MSIHKKTKTTIYKSEKQAPLLYHNKHMFFSLNLQTHKSVTIILRFPKNKYFPESFKFETMNKQKQPEKKPFTTASSLVVFHTNDFSDLIDKSTSQG